MSDGVLIAGGGLAAQRCCETLRSRGFEGPIRIVCEEERRPYDRPPLSKDVLSGKRDPATLAFRPADWYREHEVELLLGERAVALDPGTRTITLASGATLATTRPLSPPAAAPAASRNREFANRTRCARSRTRFACAMRSPPATG